MGTIATRIKLIQVSIVSGESDTDIHNEALTTSTLATIPNIGWLSNFILHPFSSWFYDFSNTDNSTLQLQHCNYSIATAPQKRV